MLARPIIGLVQNPHIGVDVDLGKGKTCLFSEGVSTWPLIAARVSILTLTLFRIL